MERINPYFFIFSLLSVILSCGKKQDEPNVFKVLSNDQTGISFSNTLKPSSELNMFNYMYFYNGAGVAAGDFNQDGMVDLFFAANQQGNRLYLNNGEFNFRDITALSGITQDGGWSTGVSVVDINNDGLLDIYVCRVGSFGPLKSRNQLLINNGNRNGIPIFSDSATAYGLDFSGFSTQAAFFDQDLDGDLDMYLMNHSLHHNGTFGERKLFTGTYHPLSGDRFYRNDSGTFRDMTREIAINSSAIGYGLGIVIADINLDGYPDIYIGNDFHENDYLYINDRKGGFLEQSEQSLMHTSQFSMGVDVSDINNDGAPEILSVDMLPADYNILKRSLGEDEYNIAQMKVKYGYQYQFTRNNLQLNRGNGHFSEIGLFSGIHATDWSWAPLWFDMDNDGYKDLFISNGIPKRLNDIDYVNYISNGEIQQKIGAGKMEETDMAVIEKFPQIRLKNKFFINDKNLRFLDMEKQIENEKPGFSNGAIYADLNNDGYLDIVVNNIDAPATIYQNTSFDSTHKNWQFHLKGSPNNLNALGARVVMFSGDKILTTEKSPVHGFLSSMEVPLQITAGRSVIDSAFLIWPDGTYEPFKIDTLAKQPRFNWRPNLPAFDFRSLYVKGKPEPPTLTFVENELGITFKHEENQYVDFNREPLSPNMLSTEGPALAIGDMNGDGRDDIFIGNARNKRPSVYLQLPDGKFTVSVQPALDADSAFEDISATWADMNGDGATDLIVVSGGNEFYAKDPMLAPRLYLNDGKGKLNRSVNAFTNIHLTSSRVLVCDINKDGFNDLIISGRAVSFAYGEIPRSYLLLNDGGARFKDVTSTLAPELTNCGMITDARWIDMDNDGDEDLLVAMEWERITWFENKLGRLFKMKLGNEYGWWNMVTPFDADGDGDIDVLAGNLGLNSRLKADKQHPVRLYYNDFDGNGRKETILTYFHDGFERPFANKFELEKQLPVLKKKFLYAENFAKATLEELFSAEKLKSSIVHHADHFATTLYINEGKGKFRPIIMDSPLQWSPCRAASIIDINGDKLPDLLTAGNFYGANIEMGRYDADYGTMSVNLGQGKFQVLKLQNLALKGQIRDLQIINTVKGKHIVAAFNNDSLRIIRISPPHGQ